MQIKKEVLTKLTNDGKLQLYFLGVGSAFATKNRQTNFLIIKGDTHIMVDFGMTGPTALKENTTLNVTDLGVFLPTHSHADHIGGLEAAAQLNRYVARKFMGKPKLKMIVGELYQEILWRSISGGLEWNEEIVVQDSQRRLNFNDYFDIVRPKWLAQQPREILTVEFGGIKIELFRTKHIPDSALDWQSSMVSYGMCIDGKVLYSGDTKFDPELIDIYGKNAETIIHDVQFFNGGVHASINELRGLNADIKKKMLLVHYGDDFEKHDVSDFAGLTQPGTFYTW